MDYINNYKLLQNVKYDFILYFCKDEKAKNYNVIKFLRTLAKSSKIILTNLTLIDNYKQCSKIFSYWNELDFYFEYHKDGVPTYRPLIFASNDYCLYKNKDDINIIDIKNCKSPYYNEKCYYVNEKSIYNSNVDNNIAFKKELLIYAPCYVACNFIKNNFDKDLTKYIISDKNEIDVLMKKNEIGSAYRIYFNCVLKTSFFLSNNKVYSKTKFINTKNKEVTNGKIVVISGIKRYLSNCKTVADVINENINDKKFVIKQFENFLLAVFNKYKTKNDNFLLSKCINSATLQNCLLVDNKYIFFDEKHKLKDKYVDKSFILFTSIYNSTINDLNLKNELYIYFCIKFKLPYKLKNFIEYQKQLWDWDGVCIYNIDKKHLVNTIKEMNKHLLV